MTLAKRVGVTKISVIDTALGAAESLPLGAAVWRGKSMLGRNRALLGVSPRWWNVGLPALQGIPDLLVKQKSEREIRVLPKRCFQCTRVLT